LISHFFFVEIFALSLQFLRQLKPTWHENEKALGRLPKIYLRKEYTKTSRLKVLVIYEKKLTNHSFVCFSQEKSGFCQVKLENRAPATAG